MTVPTTTIIALITVIANSIATVIFNILIAAVKIDCCFDCLYYQLPITLPGSLLPLPLCILSLSRSVFLYSDSYDCSTLPQFPVAFSEKSQASHPSHSDRPKIEDLRQEVLTEMERASSRW